MATRHMVAVDALLRWNDAQLGSVPPDRFIPVAEATGLILPLGTWVLEAACRQAAQWAQQGMALRIAVNLSALQLRPPPLADLVQEQFQRHTVLLGLLALEMI